MKDFAPITTKIQRDLYKKIQMFKLEEDYSSVSSVIEMLWEHYQDSKSQKK